MQSKEQFAATQKANADMEFGLSIRIIDGIEKLIKLNLQTMRAELDDTLDLTCRILSVKEPQELPALQGRLAESAAEKVQSYNQHLIAIVAAIQAEYLESTRCTQTKWETYGRQATMLLEDVAKSTPNGSGAAVTALDPFISAISALYETLQQAGQQVIEVARSNLEAAATAASKSARRASETAAPGATQ